MTNTHSISRNHVNPRYDSDENNKVDNIEGSIKLDKVNLPTPTSSVYATPSGASASSENKTLLDSLESGWTYSENDPNNSISSTQPATDWYVEGSGSLKIAGGGSLVDGGVYGRYSKDFDLTGISILVITVKGDGSADGGNGDIRVIIGGTVEFSNGNTSAFETTVNIDVSGYTGITTIELENNNTSGTAGNIGNGHFDKLMSCNVPASNLIDDDTTTEWGPDSSDTAPIYAQIDVGGLNILGAVRFYCGSSGVPSSVDIRVSEDGSTWETVVSGFSPTSGSWNEVTFPAKYARYVRIVVSSTSDRVHEVDYWDRITDRVASEHGHTI